MPGAGAAEGPAPPASGGRRLHPLATPDGWTIHLEEHPAAGSSPVAALLLVPGMMLDRRAMDRPAGRGLASFFRARGYAVYTLDLRGHGASRPAASAAVDWCYDDLVAVDLPVALSAVAARHPGLPVGLLGHSLGAIAGAAAVGCRPELPVDLLVLLAPSVWIRALEPSLPIWLYKRALLGLWGALARRFGYWPGGGLRIGTDDEPRGFVAQFREWGASGRWTSRDGGIDYLEALGRVGRPTLLVNTSADPISRRASARRLARHLTGSPRAGAGEAPVEVWQIAARDLGRRRPPMHMALAVDPACAPVWARIDDWMRRHVGRSDPAGTIPSAMATALSPARTIQVAAAAADGRVRLESRPRPEPGPGELLLRLSCCGLCGTDLWKLERPREHGGAAEGAVLGHEVVGVVEEVGPGAVGFAAGDRMAVPHHVACGSCPLCRRGSDTLCPLFRDNLLAPGGFSDRLLVGERAVRLAAFGLPDGLPDEAAVFLEPAACVLRGVRKSGLDPIGNTAAVATVIGAGSMGLLHLLVLRALWPGLRVAVSEPLAERRAAALRLGADAAVAPAEAGAAVMALSGGLGADAVFDTAGGAEALAAAIDLTRPGGTAVLFAHDHAPEASEGECGRPTGFDLNRFFRAERRLVATYSSGLAEQRDVYRLLVTGRLDPSPLVTHRLPLSRCAEAVELARSRRALKVLLVPDAG